MLYLSYGDFLLVYSLKKIGIASFLKTNILTFTVFLQAAIPWWESTPAGRVINRLCADVYLVDDSLPFTFNIFLASLFNLSGSIVIALLALPLLAPLIVILFVIYYAVQVHYLFFFDLQHRLLK